MGRGSEDCGAVGCQPDAGSESCPIGFDCYASEIPEHPMKIGPFALDKYEVTVDRFRRFVVAYADGWRPAVGDGANPNVTVADTSWRTGWDDSVGTAKNLPLTGATSDETRANFQTRLKCNATYQTWTDGPTVNDYRAVNCVNWYEAFAFCIWDGGRLPTEAEWEYAAAGGDQNLLYPWGSAAPDCSHANYADGTVFCGPNGTKAVSPVGAYLAGNGRWGHAELAGNVREWVLDSFPLSYVTAQNDNYVYVSSGPGMRDIRGGSFAEDSSSLRAVGRYWWDGFDRNFFTGLRCARSP
jgi:sulfatase modifying factor 1